MVTCPLCHSTKTIFSFTSQNRHGSHLLDTKNKFKVFTCLACQSIFLPDIKITPKYYSQFYPQNYYPDSANLTTKIYQKLFTPNYSLKFQNLLKTTKKISILDIGCGDGYFLSSLPNKYQKFGIDTSANAVKICQSKNITAKLADITKSIPFTQKFELITLNHVFEHLADTQLALKNISTMLKPSGILIISVPLSDSLGFHLSRKFWFHLDSPRHLFIPSLKGLTIFLNKNNIKVVKVTRNPFEFPLDLFWSVLNKPFCWPLLIFYPIIKLFDMETATFICQKN